MEAPDLVEGLGRRTAPVGAFDPLFGRPAAGHGLVDDRMQVFAADAQFTAGGVPSGRGPLDDGLDLAACRLLRLQPGLQSGGRGLDRFQGLFDPPMDGLGLKTRGRRDLRNFRDRFGIRCREHRGLGDLRPRPVDGLDAGLCLFGGRLGVRLPAFQHLVEDDVVHDPAVQAVGGQQGVVADLVDHPRDARGRPEDPGEGVRREHLRLGRAAGHRHAAAHVLGGLLGGQGPQVEAPEQPLVELPHARPGEALAQLGLAQDADLQEFGVVGLEVAQHPQHLEALVGQVLGLVEHHHHQPVGGEFAEQVLLEGLDQLEIAALRRAGQVELGADRRQQLSGRQLVLGDDRHAAQRLDLPGEHPGDQRLAGPDLAGDQQKALALLAGVLQRGQGLLVIRRAVVERRVGGVVERRPVQAEVSAVHGSLSWESGGRGLSDIRPGRPAQRVLSDLPAAGLRSPRGSAKKTEISHHRPGGCR